MSTVNFKILTLGTSGAGKTVFLASMFKKLLSQEDGQFNLEVEDTTQRKQLSTIYTQLISGDKWPEGTRGYSEWTFTCRVQTEDFRNHSACKFTYFDYAGGRLTDEEFEPEFLEIIHQADAILCLLDGQKIYKWLSDKRSLRHKMPNWLAGKESPEVADFLQKELPKILDCLQRSDAPIQFVLSKSDIFKGKFKLETIRDHLLSIPQFQQVVQERNTAGAVVRLIPVSAVGSEFAQFRGGRMKQIKGAIPTPEWVEVPIACVLPDRLKSLLHKIAIEKSGKPGNGFEGVGLLARLFEFGASALKLFVKRYGEQWVKVVEAVEGFSKYLGPFLEKKAEERKEQLAASLQHVNDQKSALNHAIKSFLHIQQKFLEAYPESEVDSRPLTATSTESR